MQKSVDFRVRMRYYSYQLCECSEKNLWRELYKTANFISFCEESRSKNLNKKVVDKKFPMIYNKKAVVGK